MSLEDLIERLMNLSLTAVGSPEVLNELLEEARRAAEDVGLMAFRRCEGYALGPDETSLKLGLPHLRLGLYGDRLLMWVRGPSKASLLEETGRDPFEYCALLLRGGRAIADTIRSRRAELEFLESRV